MNTVKWYIHGTCLRKKKEIFSKAGKVEIYPKSKGYGETNLLGKFNMQRKYPVKYEKYP